MNWRILVPAGFAAWFLLGMAQLAEAADVAANYKQHCAACHGPDRLGGIGPALIPENLARLRKPEAEKVIREGRPATQMLGFGQQLNERRNQGAGRVRLHADQADAGLGREGNQRLAHRQFRARQPARQAAVQAPIR